MQIGSILELDIETFIGQVSCHEIPLNWNLEYKNHLYFNTGRSAIKYLFEQILNYKNEEKVLVPAYLCTSIVDALEQVGIGYEFYNVDDQFDIDIEDIKTKITDKTKAIFFIQYFGFAQKQEVMEALKELSNKGILLIEDLTQSMFSTNQYIGTGDYAIGSIRKWLPIPDGGILWSNELLPMRDMETGYNEYMTNFLLAQLMKSEYHKSGETTEKAYRTYIQKAEKALDHDKAIRKITDLSYELIQKYDYKLLRNRIDNYVFLKNALRHLQEVKVIFENVEGVIPLGCPVRVVQKEALMQYLAENQVYCPVHWPLNEKIYNEYPHLKKLYEEILTIPCDQRYTIADMKRIHTLINRFYSK